VECKLKTCEEGKKRTATEGDVLIQPNALPPNPLSLSPQMYLIENEHIHNIQPECSRKEIGAKGRTDDEGDWEDEGGEEVEEGFVDLEKSFVLVLVGLAVHAA